MKNITYQLVFLFLFSIPTAFADHDEEDYVVTNPLHFDIHESPGSFIEPPGQLEDSDEETFKAIDLIGTSINGMLDESCGGYCITGFCAHLKLGFSLRRGPYFYTIISPKIEHALPELLISSYNNIGEEPFKEWRSTFGTVIKTANSSVGSFLGVFDGLQGGRPDPINQGNHQTVSFKEVDIIGHPLAILPDLINEGSSPSLSGYKVPKSGFLPKFNINVNTPTVTLSSDTQKEIKDSGFSIDTSKIKIPTFNELKDKIKIPSLNEVKEKVKDKAKKAIQSLDIVQQIKEIKKTAQTVKNIKKKVNTALDIAEKAVKSTGWGNFARPRYRMPRLFCPTKIKPLQPYYLSFMDSFWWRSGYPITDGPISGSNKSLTIINPVSLDTLPHVSSAVDTIKKEIWGHLYPRDGSINQSHDAKTASVLAWRGLDVLKTSVKAGHRVGVPLPNNNAGKWQMIYPEVKECRADPYYPSSNKLKESLKTSSAGGYAWNYYSTYDCCSNTSGSKIGEVSLPKICINLGDVLDGIESDRKAYERWLIEQEYSDGR